MKIPGTKLDLRRGALYRVTARYGGIPKDSIVLLLQCSYDKVEKSKAWPKSEYYFPDGIYRWAVKEWHICFLWGEKRFWINTTSPSQLQDFLKPLVKIKPKSRRSTRKRNTHGNEY